MLKYWIWLAELPGLKSEERLEVLRRFGDPEKAYYADAGEALLAEGASETVARALEDKRLDGAERILADCRLLGLRVLTYQDAEYPNRLRDISDSPLLLYVRGNLPAVDGEPVIAVVGTRRCTPYGASCGERYGYGLAKGGAVVVSGMARGVDTAALRGALRGGGTPIGVVGGGVDVVYPPENGALYEDVAAVGAVVSEYPPGTEPEASHFPARNRIMAAMAAATVVVEAPPRSGALITSQDALNYGRDVFAVPGPIDAPDSAGSNRLLLEGGTATLDPGDILSRYADVFPNRLRPDRELEPPKTPEAPPREAAAKPALPTVRLADLPENQAAVLRVLTEEPKQMDDIIRDSGLPSRQAMAALLGLEMDKRAARHEGKRYARRVNVIE